MLEDIDAASLEDVVKRRDEATNGEEIDTKVEEKVAPVVVKQGWIKKKGMKKYLIIFLSPIIMYF